MHSDYRHDPFTDASTAITITGEAQMIPAGSPYTIRLNEVPLKETPSGIVMRIRDVLTAAIATAGATSCTVMNGSWFAINDVITIDTEQMLVTNVSGSTLTITRGYNGTTAATHSANIAVYGPAWSEFAATPAARQYWPDYGTGADSDDNWNTGTVIFNSADAGKVLDISYKGTGTLASIDAARNYQPWMSGYGDGSDGHFISSGSDTIDGVKQYKSFTILPGHTVTVGSLPLWLLCQGPVLIKGTLTAVGGAGQSNAMSNPAVGTSRGGANTGIAYDWSSTPTAVGGASGGGATTNKSFWRGMQVADTNATPAAAYQLMMALAGEPGGGAAGATETNKAGQGGSGGSVVIACRRYRNAGTLSVAAGANGAASGTYSGGDGGGGGGGGGVKIVAPSVSIESGGVLTVAGGAGGNGAYACSAGTPAAGWYKIFETN